METKIIKYIDLETSIPQYAIMEGRKLFPTIVFNLEEWKTYREEVHLQEMKEFYGKMSDAEFKARFPNETIDEVIERQKWNIIFEEYGKE